ncbi:MAG: ribulose-phosphate 3-epimerase [Cytophagales bacterium]|nr:ribulose-phosphate 3-epimerase [Cytophagales bacterium]
MSLIAPSILNSDFLHLGSSIHMINESDADWIHLDVMDGSFVPNISFGLPIVEAAKEITEKPLDVHLMIVNPEKYIEGFRKAGADLINVHYEACKDKDLIAILKEIRKSGARPAIALNPDTPVQEIFEFCAYVDMVLIMSVFPGFGGQKFIEATYDRVKELKKFLNENQLETLIQVDGGVSHHNIAKLKSCGVDVMVVGSVIFNGENSIDTISELKSLVN